MPGTKIIIWEVCNTNFRSFFRECISHFCDCSDHTYAIVWCIFRIIFSFIQRENSSNELERYCLFFTQILWCQTNSEKSNLSANHDGVIFQKSFKSWGRQQSIFSVHTARGFWSISNLWQSLSKQRASKSAILAIFHFRKVASIFKFDRGQPT